MSSRRTVLILAVALLFVSQIRNVAAAIPTVQYQTGRYGRRSEVPHPVRLWSDNDYTTSTDIDTFVSRIKAEAFNNWKYGSREGGQHPIWFPVAFDRASTAYKHGSHFADGGDYFAFVSRMIWEPMGKGYMNALYAMDGMPMPELALQRNG